MYKGTLIHTIKQSDVGHSIINSDHGPKILLSGTLGYVQPHDVGKQLYLSNGIVQIENDSQLKSRLLKENPQ